MAATFVAFSSGSATATSVAVAAPTGLIAGDHQLLIVGMSGGTTETVTTPAGWTLLQAVTNTLDSGPYQTHTFISSTDVGSVTVTKSGTTAFHVVRVAWRGGPGFDIATAASSQNAANTAMALQPVTTTTGDALVIGVLHCDSGSSATSWTPPAGWTERVDLTALSGRSIGVFEIVRASAGTQTGTATANRSDFYNAIGVALSGVVAIGPVTDSGAGDDTSLTVDKTDLVSAIESGTGDDPITLAADTGTSTDTGTGADTITLEVLDPIPVTDTGSATETITIANFVAFDLPETGSGTETITIDQFHFFTEDGIGDDAHSLLQQLADLTDTATGTDTLIGLAIPSISDSGTGADLISIVDIPFTQVLPPSRLGNLYDLLVMARVPQENGPPLFIEVGPIEWTDLTWANELKSAQNLTVSCQGSSLLPDVVSRLRDLASYPSELWLYRNGRLVFAGPLLGGTDNGGDQLTLQAQGILTYLKVMWVRSDLVYKNVDQHTIVKNLVDHWQNQTYGNYGIVTSEIEPSGVNRTITYLKTEQHNIAQRVEELAKTDDGFDFEVDQETRQLQVWSPSKGVDRSAGEDAVVFDSRNITNSSVMFAAGPNDIATVAFGTGTAISGDGTTWAEITNPELMAKFGRAGVSGSWSQVPDQNTLNGYVRGLLVPRDHMVLVPGPDAKDTLDAELFSYGVGDTVLYQPNEVLFTSAAFRIRKQTVKVSGNGQESVTLEFV